MERCLPLAALVQLGVDLRQGAVHATKSGRILIDILKQFAQLDTNIQTVLDAISCFSEEGYPPYGPLLNVLVSVQEAILAGIPLADAVARIEKTSVLHEEQMQSICHRLLEGKKTVATYTFSETVSRCFCRCRERGEIFRVVVTESCPNKDGYTTFEILRKAGVDCTVGLDADMTQIYAGVDMALFGCEAVLSNGAVVGKNGQSLAARACAEQGVPVYIYAGNWKLLPPSVSDVREMLGAVRDRNMDPRCHSNLFDVTPSQYVTGVITERGILAPQGICLFKADD